MPSAAVTSPDPAVTSVIVTGYGFGLWTLSFTVPFEFGYRSPVVSAEASSVDRSWAAPAFA